MSWAARRRFLILLIVGAIIVAFLTILLISILYETPTCTDRKQNQDETGVDCGGSCTYLCTEEKIAPVVSLARALIQTPGRVDIIAYIDNPNQDAAAMNVLYTVTLYSDASTVLKTSTGRIDLPAGARVPIYLPAFFSGAVTDVRGFVDINHGSFRWSPSSPPLAPKVSATAISGTTDAPRVTATLVNTKMTTVTESTVIAIVYDASNSVVAASQTLIPTLKGQESVQVTFVWNKQFPSIPARIEIIPITPVL